MGKKLCPVLEVERYSSMQPTVLRCRTLFFLLLTLGGLGVPARGSACPCTIWPSTATPAIVDTSETRPVELGVKFTANSSGYITGIRFYKGVNNTGTHIGNLWSSTGTLLARAIFTTETSSGWQQVNFSTPVAITANTVYVASYYSPTGDFSVDVNYFATTGVNNPPLQALVNGGSGGGNGVYAFGSTSQFPAGTYQSSNYWVDVVFNSTTGAGGTLTITTTSLPSGQIHVAYSATLAATGGTTPFTWSLTSGTLPAGLSLNSSTGTISGTPTVSVITTPLTFQVQDSSSPQQTKTVNLALTIGTDSNISLSISPKRGGAAVNQLLTLTATVTNDIGSAGVTWAVSAGGVLASQTTSSASFSAPTAGVYTVTATSKADSSRSATATFGVTDLTGVVTYHNDLSRDGSNPSE